MKLDRWRLWVLSSSPPPDHGYPYSMECVPAASSTASYEGLTAANVDDSSDVNVVPRAVTNIPFPINDSSGDMLYRAHFVNYFSIGLDAEIANGFHLAREGCACCFQSCRCWNLVGLAFVVGFNMCLSHNAGTIGTAGCLRVIRCFHVVSLRGAAWQCGRYF